MKKSYYGSDPDLWGIIASSACALHCMAIPVLLAAGASAGLSWLDSPWMEWAFMAAALWFAGQSLMRTYLLEHRKAMPLFIAGMGFLLLVSSRFVDSHAEHYLTAVGGLTIASAHVLNWQLRRKLCRSCA